MFRNILHRKTLASFLIIYISSILQLTGKSNYEAFTKDTGIDIVTNPEIINEDLSLIIKISIWFWNKNNLNKFADAKDILGATKKINGGTNGLEDRTKHYNELMA